MTKALQLDLPFIPCSKKNNTEIRQRGSRRWVAPNKRVEQEELSIKGLARLEHPAFIAPANDVGMTVTLHISKKAGGDRCLVELEDLGLPPKRKRTGRKRDAINVHAIIADALQGVCFEDDKQIVDLRVRVRHE